MYRGINQKLRALNAMLEVPEMDFIDPSARFRKTHTLTQLDHVSLGVCMHVCMYVCLCM